MGGLKPPVSTAPAVRFDDPAREDCTIRGQALPSDFEAELVEPAARAMEQRSDRDIPIVSGLRRVLDIEIALRPCSVRPVPALDLALDDLSRDAFDLLVDESANKSLDLRSTRLDCFGNDERER